MLQIFSASSNSSGGTSPNLSQRQERMSLIEYPLKSVCASQSSSNYCNSNAFVNRVFSAAMMVCC